MSNLNVLAGLVCEEVRPEIGGRKATIVGYIGILPFVQIYLPSFDNPVSKLCFLLTVDKGEGTFLIRTRILNMGGNDILEEPLTGTVTIFPTSEANLVINLQGVRVEQPGKYTLELSADGEVAYVVDFSIMPLADDAVNE